MAAYLCVRVYANGDARYTVRDDAGLESWLAHNRRFRWGNALFVDGCLPDPAKDRGYLNDEQIAIVMEKIAEETPGLGRLMAWQVAYDRIEKSRIYPEMDWPRFDWLSPIADHVGGVL